MNFINNLAARFKTATKKEEALPAIKIVMMNLDKLSFDEEFKGMFTQEEEKVNRIAENMKANGFDVSQPIIITPDGKILDGNSRFLACKIAGITEVPVIIKEFQSKDEALDYEYHLQFDRRNMSDAEIYSAYQRIVAKRNPDGTKAKTDVEIAAELNISPRQIGKIKEVERKASPEVLESFKNGEISLNKAYNQMKEETKIPEPVTDETVVESAKVEEVQAESKEPKKKEFEKVHLKISLDDYELLKIASEDEQKSVEDFILDLIEKKLKGLKKKLYLYSEGEDLSSYEQEYRLLEKELQRLQEDQTYVELDNLRTKFSRDVVEIFNELRLPVNYGKPEGAINILKTKKENMKEASQ